MLPGVSAGPGDDQARAFLAAVFAALESKCDCEPCQILRRTSKALRAALLPPSSP